MTHEQDELRRLHIERDHWRKVAEQRGQRIDEANAQNLRLLEMLMYRPTDLCPDFDGPRCALHCPEFD